MANDFEAARQANIAKNKALLAKLDVREMFDIIKKAPPKAKQSKKRKEVPVEENDDEEAQPPRKVAPVVTPAGGPRRSGRNAGKTIDYSGDGDHIARDDGPKVLTKAARAAEAAGEAKSVMQRKYDP